MRERAVTFGNAAILSGILTEPGKGQPVSSVGVVILNSGILHRVGASRLYVQLSRALVQQGFASLRFDFSGVGDSESRRDSLPFEESSIVEAREAMDYLAKRKGVESFILMGLCSGADMAYHTALADERVVGIAQLDGFVYRTWRYYVKRYGAKALSPKQWAHSIKVRVAPDGTEGDKQDASIYEAPEYRRNFPPKEEIEAGLKTLMDRGAHLYHFFSGDQPEHVNHREQYEEAFSDVPFCGRLHVEFCGTADHTVTGLQDQRFVVEGISAWAAEHFQASVPSEPVPA